MRCGFHIASAWNLRLAMRRLGGFAGVTFEFERREEFSAQFSDCLFGTDAVLESLGSRRATENQQKAGRGELSSEQLSLRAVLISEVVALQAKFRGADENFA